MLRLMEAESRTLLPLVTTDFARFFPPEGESDGVCLRCCQERCRCYLEFRQWCDELPSTTLPLASFYMRPGQISLQLNV